MDLTDRWILWSIVAAYMAFVFFKGVSKVKHVGDTDDFLVAGRNVGWFPLACTMGATVIGGGASIGAIGRTYEWGVLMLLVSLGWYLHFIFSGLFVAPKFRDAKLYTVAGYFGHRFGEGPRGLILILSLLASVFILAAQMAAFGSVVAAIAPNAASASEMLRWAILIGGTMVVIYSTAGGLMAVITTDVYQFIILIGGFLVTLAACVPDLLSSWGRVTSEVPATFFTAEGGHGWLFLITTFLAFLLGETFAPGYATRYCVGRNIQETKRGIAGVGVFLAILFPAILFFIALYARIHFPEIEPQEALPRVVQELNNPLIGGLMIGALLMAVMSSADSALNSATAIFVKDLFEHQLGWNDGDDGRLLKMARACTIGLGLTAVGVAILLPDIINLLLFSYTVWAPAVILPVCVGVFTANRSARQSRDIFLTMAGAAGLTLIYSLLPYLRDQWGMQLFPDAVYAQITEIDAAVFGVAMSCLIYGALRITARAK